LATCLERGYWGWRRRTRDARSGRTSRTTATFPRVSPTTGTRCRRRSAKLPRRASWSATSETPTTRSRRLYGRSGSGVVAVGRKRVNERKAPLIDDRLEARVRNIAVPRVELEPEIVVAEELRGFCGRATAHEG